MMRTDCVENLVDGNSAARIGLHGLDRWKDLLPKPLLDLYLTILQSLRARPNDIVGGIGPGLHKRVEAARAPQAASGYASSITYGPPPFDARDESSTKRPT